MSNKAVVAVDLQGNWKSGLSLADSLKFSDFSYHFLNVVEPILPDGSFPELSVGNPLGEVMEELTQAGNKVASEAAASYTNSSFETKFGSIVYCLEESAEEQNADWLVVGSHKRSLLESIFAGSVTRSLTTSSKKSVLIGKNVTKANERLTVVFAHDMSEYADVALDRFVLANPNGISKIILLTANSTDPSIVAIVERQHPSMSGEMLDIVEAHIREKQAKLLTKLRQICPDVEAQIIAGDPKRIIRDTMNSSKADLLVLGAQGHNFIERLTMGSIALHMVLREPFNVLIIRW